MAGEYKLRLFDRAGLLKYEIVDFEALSLAREVNAPGLAALTLDASHPAVAEIALDWRLEVWRRDLSFGLAWRMEFEGLYRSGTWEGRASGDFRAMLLFPGPLSLLGRAVVGYKAGTAGRNTFAAAKAETIAKTLVRYNATSSGSTGDGRVVNAGLSNITIEADAARGATLDFSCAYRNALEAIREVAALGGGDFDLVRTGPASWEFRWYAGQRGTDRSATMTFSLPFGNMAEPVLERGALDERTVAIVGGQGEESARAIVLRQGANYAAGHNGAEGFVDARMHATPAALESAGDASLQEWQARDRLSFSVIQTPGSFYGLHYDFGDLVRAEVEGYTGVKKIVGVTIEVSTSGERLFVRAADV